MKALDLQHGLPAFSLLMAALAIAAGTWLPRALGKSPREVWLLRAIFGAALAVRLAAALLIYLEFPYGYFAPDEATYFHDAVYLLLGDPSIDRSFFGRGWPYFNVLLVYMFGPNQMLARLWNSVIGSLTPLVAFGVARHLGPDRGAWAPAVLVALWPSLVLWSSLGLKDANVYLVILLTFLLTFQFQDSFRLWRVAAIAAVVAVAILMRVFSVTILFGAAVLGLLLSGLRPSRRALAILGSLTVAIPALALGLVFAFPREAQSLYARLGLQLLAKMRRDFAVNANSAVDPEPGLRTLVGLLRFLPHGLVDFFLRPFPWESGSSLSALTRPEMVLYYLLLPVLVAGIALSLRRVPKRAIPMLLYLAVTGAGYAIVVSNLGTVYRERGQVLLVMLVFTGPAFGALIDSLDRRRGRPLAPADAGPDS